MADERWELLTIAKPALVREFLQDGVRAVDFVAAFPQDPFAVWLRPTSDAEARVIEKLPDLKARVVQELQRVGFTFEQVTNVAVVVQSQETIAREYGGSSFYATR